MTTMHEAEISQFLERAREAACRYLSSLPGETSTLRSSAFWPEKEVPEFDPGSVHEAVARAFGPAHASVFSFLRYFDYAHWDESLGALIMASDQRDWYLPYRVFWALTPRLLLYQQSEQPLYAGVGVSPTETARYAADAVDCVGELYRAFSVEWKVWLDITMKPSSPDGAPHREAPEPQWGAAHTPDVWTRERKQLASACVRSIFSQTDTPIESNGSVTHTLQMEFDRLSGRRLLAK